MVDWKTYKGEGPWLFAEQRNKWGYLNNPRWMNPSGAPVSYDGIEDQEPQIWTPQGNSHMNGQLDHHPCGHWHKIVSTPTPILEEPIFVIHGAPLIGSHTGTMDYCYKRDDDLNFIIRYGGLGSGIDELRCPFGVAVDDTYVWICDFNNSRLMQRLKSDLSYVQHRDSFIFQAVHTDSGSVVWVGYTSRVVEINKSDLTTIRAIEWPACGIEGFVQYAYDISSDADYLYVADRSSNRIAIYNKSTLVFVREFGRTAVYARLPIGIVIVGSYIYFGSFNLINKAQVSDYLIVDQYGHVNGGYVSPLGITADATRLFAASTDKIVVLNLADLSLITEITASLSAPVAVAVDANYIYLADYGDNVIIKYNATTYAYHSENGDRTGVITDGSDGYSFVYGIAVDGTYVYVLDQNTDLRVIRRNKATLAFVDEYRDIGWAIFINPQSLWVDGTYIYIPDDNGFHRLDKATMTYVDFTVLSNTNIAMSVVIDGSYLYATDYDGKIDKYDSVTFAYVDSSPATTGDPNYQTDYPVGVTVDEDYIYVALYAGVIKIYRRSDNVYVDEFNLPTHPGPIAVDETYLYVPLYDGVTGYTKKYLKASPFTEVASVTPEDYAISLAKWYPIDS